MYKCIFELRYAQNILCRLSSVSGRQINTSYSTSSAIEDSWIVLDLLMIEPYNTIHLLYSWKNKIVIFPKQSRLLNAPLLAPPTIPTCNIFMCLIMRHCTVVPLCQSPVTTVERTLQCILYN